VPELQHAVPRALITGYRINGIDSGISQLGAPHVGSLELGPSQNQIAIDFVGVDDRLRGDLRYQYRLSGAGIQWSRPAEQRTVTFAGMAPGRYRFEVRALDVYGGVSQAAVAEFSIHPPFWQLWWFRLLVLSTGLGTMSLLHQYRMRRVLELQRVRTRIAMDLHDDIGSGLSQIAVLAEVAGTHVNHAAPDLRPMLSKIASVSRELAESMSDIVWSVNPHRDRVSDLLQRMRRFASDLLSSHNIEIRFEVTAAEQSSAIAADVRGEVYLIFKEAVNNLVRHSGCTRAEIFASIGHRALDLRIEDNGKGLGESGIQEGNGLRSMKERTRRIGGHLELGRSSQGGARIVLRVPLRAAALTTRTT
jgi:signal transduction histidine kinase